MEIKVLGSGCATCDRLFAVVEQAVAQSGVAASGEKVQDVEAILNHGVVAMPALMVNGKVLSSGRVPDVREVSILLTSAAMAEHGTG